MTRKSDILKQTWVFTIDKKDWNDFWKDTSTTLWPEKLMTYFQDKGKKKKVTKRGRV